MPLQRALRVEAQPAAALTVLHHALDAAHECAEVPERRWVYRGLCGVSVRRATVEVQFRRAARKDGFEVFDGDAPAFPGCRPQNLPVVARHAGDVQGGLHAPLYLERRHARLRKLARVVAEAQVLHGKRIAAGGRRGSACAYRLTAAVRTRAPVAAAAFLHCAEKAKPRDRVAEGPVNEALKLHLGTSVGGLPHRPAATGDLRDFLKRKFAREDNAAEAKSLQRQDAFEVVRDELG